MRSLQLFKFMLIAIGLAGCSDAEHPFEGKDWTVINYWAVWCKPCREEIPELNVLNGESGIRVFGVNFDRKTGAPLEADANALGLAFANIEDPSSQLGIERPSVLPTTVVITPMGEVAAVLVGPQTSDSILAIVKPGLAMASDKKTPTKKSAN